MLQAWKQLRKLRREEAMLAELPIASLQALLANINRDPKRGQPFELKDFQLFAKAEQEQAKLPAEVAAVALDLRHQDRAPAVLLTIWPDVLASIKADVKAPAVRALANDAQTVWVLCPAFDGRHVRGALVMVTGWTSGRVRLRDIDRPLAYYDVTVPRRVPASWIEVGLLLKGET